MRALKEEKIGKQVDVIAGEGWDESRLWCLCDREVKEKAFQWTLWGWAKQNGQIYLASEGLRKLI